MEICNGLGSRLLDIENRLDNPQEQTPQPRVVIPGFSCDPASVVGKLVVADHTVYRRVNVVNSNTIAEIPQGALGVLYFKYNLTTCSILIRGLIGGFSGLLPGQPVYCGSDGLITHNYPVAPCTSHRLGTAISDTEIIFDPHTPFRRP